MGKKAKQTEAADVEEEEVAVPEKKKKKCATVTAEGDVREDLKRKVKVAKEEVEAAAAPSGEPAEEIGKKKKNKQKATQEGVAADQPAEEEQAKQKKKGAKSAAKTAPVEAEAAEADEDADAEAAPKKKKKKTGEAAPAEEAKGKTVEKGSQGAADGSDPNPFRIFVGGIPWSIDEDTLRKDFGECGTVVDLKLLMDRETGQSRGIAFITMADEDGFKAALKYDGEDYCGRTLNVSKANSDGGKGDKGKGDKGKGKGKSKDGKGKGKGPGEKPAGCTSVVLKGLSYEATSADLQKLFAKCGSGPTNVKLLTDRETGESKGMAFIDFDDGAAVDQAMKLTETMLKGRAFFMDYSKPREW